MSMQAGDCKHVKTVQIKKNTVKYLKRINQLFNSVCPFVTYRFLDTKISELFKKANEKKPVVYVSTN